MSNYTATIIKAGNSYALRVPKQYIEDNNLKQGQKVQVGAPLPVTEYDPEKLELTLRELQKIGAFKGIKNPVAWQREIRKDRPLPFRNE